MICMTAFRMTLKLQEGKPPHLYLNQLKQLIEGDKTLHPMMEKTLKMLKRTRTPFIYLSTKREVIYDGDNFRHFDRSASPTPGAWICTIWSEEEAEQYKKDKKGHMEAFMKMMQKLGYEFFNTTQISDEYLKTIESLCEEQIRAQMIAQQRYDD